MKIIFTLILVSIFYDCHSNNFDDFIRKTIDEKCVLIKSRNIVVHTIENEIKDLEVLLYQNQITLEKKVDVLIEILQLERSLKNAIATFDMKFVKFRYQKGIEILKMVYEKILSLDHHFGTLRSFQDIALMSNPNSYPEFVKIKENLKSNTKSKDPIRLPVFLDNNPLISMGYAVVSSFFGTGDKQKRQGEMEKISCLLDFTLSMQSDLKIIYYETDYLKLNNQELKGKCIQLFKDYTKVIGYKFSLDYCRDIDDWDNVISLLDETIRTLNNYSDQPFSQEQKSIKHNINNLEFSIDRLLGFINEYSLFISQGEKYYHKFLSILKNYEHKDICISQLPTQYLELENEILQSIDKFETAYNVAELKGTKLRDLLYGSPE
ncbi:MAG: hypothetical protein HKO66_14705 [Saprospiraceae bacterium]|nr:hypothetical protein [Saprospiraceae bacterium]